MAKPSLDEIFSDNRPTLDDIFATPPTKGGVSNPKLRAQLDYAGKQRDFINAEAANPNDFVAPIGGLQNITNAIEGVSNVLTGLTSFFNPKPGYKGILAGIADYSVNKNFDSALKAASDVIGEEQKKLVYTPETPQGRRAGEILNAPFTVLSELGSKPQEWMQAGSEKLFPYAKRYKDENPSLLEPAQNVAALLAPLTMGGHEKYRYPTADMPHIPKAVEDARFVEDIKARAEQEAKATQPPLFETPENLPPSERQLQVEQVWREGADKLADQMAEGRTRQFDIVSDGPLIKPSLDEIFSTPPEPKLLPAPERIVERQAALEEAFSKGDTYDTELGKLMGAERERRAQMQQDAQIPAPDTTKEDGTLPKFTKEREPTTSLYSGLPIHELKNVDLGKMLNDVYKLSNKAIPPSVRTKISGAFSFPQYLAEKSPEIKKVYDNMQEWNENRHAIASDLFKENPEQGYAGLTALDKTVNKLSKTEYKAFHDLIESGDISKMSFEAADILNGTNPLKIKGSKQLAAAYDTFNKVMQNVGETLVTKLKDIAVAQFKEEPWFPQVIEAIQQGATLEQIKASQGLPDGFASAFKTVAERLDRIENEIAPAIMQNPGYMWRVRPKGDYFVRAYEIDPITGERGQEVFMRPAKSLMEAERMQRLLEKKPEARDTDWSFPINAERMKAERGKQTLESGKDYEISIDRNETPTEEVMVYTGTGEAKASVIEQAIADMVKTGELDAKLGDKVASAVINKTADMYQARGYGRHFLGRKENLIEGYDRQNYVKTLVDQVNAMAGYLSKAEFMSKSVKEVAKAGVDEKTILNDMIRDWAKNEDPTMAKYGATARNILTFTQLAFKPVSALVNGFQPAIWSIPELNFRFRKEGIKASADKAFVGAWRDLGLNKLNPMEQAMIEQFSRIGGDQSQLVREVSGIGEPAAIKSLQKATEIGMSAFSKIEQVWNREASFLAAFREYYKKTGDIDISFDKAKDFSNLANVDMSKQNLPQVVRRMPGGRTLFAFQRYSASYLSWLFNRAVVQGNLKPVIRSLITTAALGGIGAGIPFGEDINRALERVMGISPKLFLRKVLKNTSKELGASSDQSQALTNFVINGAPSLVGINLNRNLSIQAPLLSTILQEGMVADKAVSGVWSSFGTRGVNSMKAFSQGDTLRGIENFPLLPQQGSNMLSAYRQSTQGTTTMGGNPVLDGKGKQLKMTGAEALLKATSFNPNRIANEQDINTSIKNLSTYYKDKADSISAQLAKARASRDSDRIRKALEERAAFNKEVREKKLPIDKVNIKREKPKADKKTMKFRREFE